MARAARPFPAPLADAALMMSGSSHAAKSHTKVVAPAFMAAPNKTRLLSSSV
jgi:hypothetical protein